MVEPIRDFYEILESQGLLFYFFLQTSRLFCRICVFLINVLEIEHKILVQYFHTF